MNREKISDFVDIWAKMCLWKRLLHCLKSSSKETGLNCPVAFV